MAFKLPSKNKSKKASDASKMKREVAKLGKLLINV